MGLYLLAILKRPFSIFFFDKSDRDCFRFLWLEDPPDVSKIVVYRFCRVVFGLNASPFLLNATLRHHISKFAEVDPEFARKLIESFYADVFVSGGGTSEEVQVLYGKTCTRMSEGGFKLRKWMTNDVAVRKKTRGGGVLPYMGYIGMCGPKGYGFSAVLVINRVSILADFGHFGHK